jgi:hypothetical protein
VPIDWQQTMRYQTYVATFKAGRNAVRLMVQPVNYLRKALRPIRGSALELLSVHFLASAGTQSDFY